MGPAALQHAISSAARLRKVFRISTVENGAAGEIRTLDLSLTKGVLYP